MNRNQLAELLKYSSPKSILVVTYNDKIIELKVPFRVEAIHDIGFLTKGKVLEVEKVMLSTNVITVFIISGSAYHFYWFNILID